MLAVRTLGPPSPESYCSRLRHSLKADAMQNSSELAHMADTLVNRRDAIGLP